MRLWVNKARTVLVSEMEDGNLTVALRDEPEATWGVPIYCTLERPDYAPIWKAIEDGNLAEAQRLIHGDTNRALGHRESRA